MMGKKIESEFAKRPVKEGKLWDRKDFFKKTVDTRFEFVKDVGSSKLDI